MKIVAKEVDELQLKFDERQKSLMAAGLTEDAVILLQESQVQRVVQQCKESPNGPIHSLQELECLVASKEKESEKAPTSALNLEVC